MHDWRSPGEDGDVMNGAELVPGLLVIFRGWIVKGSQELVKEVVCESRKSYKNCLIISFNLFK